MSDFIVIIHTLDKIRSIDEVFEECQLEQEQNLEYYINYIMEINKNYECEVQYQIGDIVYVNQYMYSTGKKGYAHLFVIIDKKEAGNEYFGMLISSQIHKMKYDTNILLQIDKNNKLRKNSIVKIDKVYKLNKENIIFKIGNINERLVEEYKVRCLKCNIY